MRTFNAYVSSIFLYNAELWTLTANLEKAIDSFQRRLLRSHVLNIKWPTTVKNDQLYESTQAKPWSVTIKKKRIQWLGHVLRLPKETPVQKALVYAQTPYKRPRGKPKLTWLTLMKKQLIDDHNMSWEDACDIALDKHQWKSYVDVY